MYTLHLYKCNVMEIGEKIGKWTIIGDSKPFILPCGQKNKAYTCLCECGNTKSVRYMHLKRKLSTSCGCYRNSRNGMWNNPIFKIWKAMNERCSGVTSRNESYVKNNITVCDEWKYPNNENFINFYDWCLLNNHKKGMHIDRINTFNGYSPENCRIVSIIENMNNKSDTFYVDYNGEKVAFMLLLDRLGLRDKQYQIRKRIKSGWSVHEAINKPIRKFNRA